MLSSPSTSRDDGSSYARDSALDAARGILMVLGIFLHAANVYSIDGSWLIADSEKEVAFDYIVGLIHVFRMPAFFWISGYFCAMVVERHGIAAIHRIRLPRLLLPLAATWVLLNLPQLVLLTWWLGGSPLDVLSAGVPLYHLWFLLDLIIITSILGYASEPIKAMLGRLPNVGVMILFGALTIGTYGFSAVARASGFAYEAPLGLTSLYRLAENAPYFLAGLAMYHRPDIRRTFLSAPFLLLPPAIVGALLLTARSHGPFSISTELALIGEIFLKWVCIGGLIHGFVAWFSQPSRLTAFLAESAYSIYLFHHGLVVLFGIMMMPVELGATGKYLVVCVATIVLSGAVHIFVVRRSKALRRLFNGK